MIFAPGVGVGVGVGCFDERKGGCTTSCSRSLVLSTYAAKGIE